MRNKNKIMLLPLFALLLTSCNLFTITTPEKKNPTNDNTSNKTDDPDNSNPSDTEDKTDGTKKDDEKEDIEKKTLVDFDETLPTDTVLQKKSYSGYYKTSNMEEYRMEKYRFLTRLNEAYYGNDSYRMPTMGSGKLLVIPVYFSDVEKPTDEQLDNINKAFFGKEEDTGWQSLASYYSSSSYGNFTFEGKVVEPYAYPKSTKNLDTNDSNEAYNYVIDILQSAIEYEKELGVDMKDYDSNSDGYIDGVDIIYFYDATVVNSTMFWQYTTADYSSVGDANDPVAKRFFFSGYNYITTGYYDPDIDSHTLIHETGHMLGLDDYYNYDSNIYRGSYPAGLTDMMDHNVGDHNAYSKMLMGWVNPYVIDGTSDDFTISLNSFTETGDCIVFRNTKEDPFNGTPYDEYLILEYYTPTGVNEEDSTGYKEWYTQNGKTLGTFSIPGLKVYHVDSRAITTDFSISNKGISYSNSYYTDTPLVSRKTVSANAFNPKYSYSTIPSNNTPSYAKTNLVDSNSSYHTITAIPADTSITYTYMNTNNYYKVIANLGNNANLFTATGNGGGASTFKMSDYAKYFEKEDRSGNATFNDGTTLEYTFTVTSNDSKGCTIHFEKEDSTLS